MLESYEECQNQMIIPKIEEEKKEPVRQNSVIPEPVMNEIVDSPVRIDFENQIGIGLEN